jgi:HprK-related kinase A
LIVADLSGEALAHTLAAPGLRLRTGPFVSRIQSRVPQVRDAIALHYADHPVEDASCFADFHVRLASPPTLRRWVRPQVVFELDGTAPFHPFPVAQAFPILEWGLNWCVSNHCHQYLIVHAAVLEKSGNALVMSAPPGAGKSTLCAGLASRGWRLLSDELALIEPASGDVAPLPRPISLKNASIEVIRAFVSGAELGSVVRDTAKGSVAHLKPPVESVKRASERARPRWVLLPRYEAGAAARLNPLARGPAFMKLADNAFNYHLHGRTGFDVLAALVEACQCYEFSYGDLEEAVRTFDALAENA